MMADTTSDLWGQIMQKIKIGNVCDVLNGFAFKSENYVGSGIRVIRIANVQKGYIEDTTPAFYPLDSGGLDKYMLENGDLLMSLTGNVGRVAMLEADMLPAALNQRVACLRLKSSKISKKYLFHILNSDYFEQQCIQSSKGVAQKNMSTEWLKDYEIPLYSPEQQNKIASVLDRVHLIINTQKKQLQKLDELVKARFVEMFGDPVTNLKGWTTKTLLDMGYCKNGMNFHNGDSGLKIHCLGVGDFKDLSVIDGTEHLPVISLNEAPSEESMLRDGDIVFVRSNGNKALVGRCLAVYPRNTPTTYSGFCIRYRLTSSEVDVTYLLQVLKTDSMRRKMAGRGANIQNLNQQVLAALDIPLPPIEQQQQFAAFVEQIDKSKVAVQKSLDEAQLLFDSLMQQYFE